MIDHSPLDGHNFTTLDSLAYPGIPDAIFSGQPLGEFLAVVPEIMQPKIINPAFFAKVIAQGFARSVVIAKRSAFLQLRPFTVQPFKRSVGCRLQPEVVKSSTNLFGALA